MSMIVARMQKMKADNLIGIGNHNQRKTENHSNKDIDPSLSDLNYDLVNHTENYKKDIENFINENKSSIRAVRKDAVLINEWIITSDKKFFENLSNEETRDFFQVAKDHFSENFGEENIRYAIVHLDESTPHMHMGIVPFDKDKKLSAKRVFNREALRNVQEDLPKYLQEQGFDIERGREGSERKNLTVPEFKKMKEEEKEIERSIESKKNEFRSYIKDRSFKSSIDNIKTKKEIIKVKVPSGEKFLGHEFTKTVEKETGNLIISKKDFKNIQDFILYSKKNEANLLNMLDTDFYKRNRDLKNKLEEQKNENKFTLKANKEIFEAAKDLKIENNDLKDTVSDLRDELRITYNSVRDNFKERLGGLKASSNAFNSLVDVISSKINNSLFKSEFDEEKRKEIKRNSPKIRR